MAATTTSTSGATSASSLGELFPQCRALANDARRKLARLQQQRPPPPRVGHHDPSWSSSSSSLLSEEERAAALWSELPKQWAQITQQLQKMDELIYRETPAQRPLWKHKIQELRSQVHLYQQQTWAQQQQQAAPGNAATTKTGMAAYSTSSSSSSSSYAQEREELLRRRRKRTTTNNNNNNTTDEADLQHLADESGSLESSQVMVMDLLENGQANLATLVEQRQRLRGIRGVVLDIGHRLGLTQSTMRILERRDITDAYLVAAGMILTLLTIYLVWFVF